MKFSTPEEAVAFAMSVKPKPKCYRQKFSRRVARIGRYDRVQSTIFGRYYVDIQGPFGSDNRGVPESFPTYEAAAAYLADRDFEPAE